MGHVAVLALSRSPHLVNQGTKCMSLYTCVEPGEGKEVRIRKKMREVVSGLGYELLMWRIAGGCQFCAKRYVIRVLRVVRALWIVLRV